MDSVWDCETCEDTGLVMHTPLGLGQPQPYRPLCLRVPGVPEGQDPLELQLCPDCEQETLWQKGVGLRDRSS